MTIRQRGSVATGTNLVTLDGLNLAGGMSISLDQGAVNAVSIGANGLGVAGGLIVETSLGSITQTGNLTIGGTADLTAKNDILLARAGNDFGAAVSAKASGKIQLSDAGNLSTGKLSALRAELVAGGSIETGATSVTDLTLQSGGAFGDVRDVRGPSVETIKDVRAVHDRHAALLRLLAQEVEKVLPCQ